MQPITRATVDALNLPSAHPLVINLGRVISTEGALWLIGYVDKDGSDYCCRIYDCSGKYTFLDSRNRNMYNTAVPTQELMDKCNAVTNEVVRVSHDGITERRENILLVYKRTHWEMIKNIINIGVNAPALTLAGASAPTPAPTHDDKAYYEGYIAGMDRVHKAHIAELTAAHKATVAKLTTELTTELATTRDELAASEARATKLIEGITEFIKST